MRIGLSYDLKEIMQPQRGSPDDAFEEYDSSETVALISAALEREGHSIVKLGGGSEFLDNIRREKVDIVFNIAEGRGNYRSREAQVPSILEMLNVPYTGSDPQTLAVCLDKNVSKRLVATDGISTPRWLVIDDEQELAQLSWDGFPFPAIIKPAYEGSSKGIRQTSLANTVSQAQEEIRRIINHYRQPVLVEEFIDGDEVTVGVVGNQSPHILGIMRILPKRKDDHFVYSVEVKRDYLNLVEYECPARLEENTMEKITVSSRRILKTLGCRDFARLDFRIDSAGIPCFLEINPLPGLGSYSDLVIMALKMDWTHEKLIVAILAAALERYSDRLCM